MKHSTSKTVFRLGVTASCLDTGGTGKGSVLPFISKLRNLNRLNHSQEKLEIVVLGECMGLTGIEFKNILESKGLEADRYVPQLSPEENFKQYKLDLCVSDDEKDVVAGRKEGLPIVVLLGAPNKDSDEKSLSFAFDFDHVLSGSNGAFAALCKTDNLDDFNEHECKHSARAHQKGSMHGFFFYLFRIQQDLRAGQPVAKNFDIKLFIVTWRSFRSLKRVATSFNEWNMGPDEFYCLAGRAKDDVLQMLKVDLFIDDSIAHITKPSKHTLCAHLPRPVSVPKRQGLSSLHNIISQTGGAVMNFGLHPHQNESFEPAIQRHLCEEWTEKEALQREVGTLSGGRNKIDLAVPAVSNDTSFRGLVEVKILEQYRNSYFGHVFPGIFMGSRPDTGQMDLQHFDAQMKSYGWDPDDPAKIQKMKQLIKNISFYDAENNSFCNADEGQLLLDMLKMVRESRNHPEAELYSLLYVMTYPGNTTMDHVHQAQWTQEQLQYTFKLFHDRSKEKGQFEVNRWRGKNSLAIPYQPFAIEADHQNLGLQSWNRGKELVQRKVSIITLKYRLDVDEFAYTLHPSPPPLKKKRSKAVSRIEPADNVYWGAFDLETKRSAREVGGWGNADKMGISVGVVYDSADGLYHSYFFNQIDDLVAHLQRLDLVVGFNNIRFDNKVLTGASGWDCSKLPSLDLLTRVPRKKGRKCGLDALGKHTLGARKSADGLQALEWFKEKEFKKLADYCREDVKLTKDLYLHGLRHGYVYCEENGMPQRCEVDFTNRKAA